MSKPILLIDGDQFLYRACAAVEQEVRWDLENHVLFSNAEDAFATAMGGINKVRERFKGSPVRLAFTKTESFRKGFFEPYKGNRVAIRKPMCYVETRERLEAEFSSLAIDGLEADDILGIWATLDNRPSIIVSDDKDLQTIPGKLLRQGVLETISEEQADFNWMLQTLKGDTADNFPGCPGVGEETATAHLTERMALKPYEHTFKSGPRKGTTEVRYEKTPVDTLWEVTVSLFESKGLTAEDALIQARCSRILRSSDWDTEKKEVKLWTP